jgi:hypothetical protein
MQPDAGFQQTEDNRLYVRIEMLFRFCRRNAETLGRLLDAKRTLQSIDWTGGAQSRVDALLQHPNGLRTLNVALAEVRKAGLSSYVADISVA